LLAGQEVSVVLLERIALMACFALLAGCGGTGGDSTPDFARRLAASGSAISGGVSQGAVPSGPSGLMPVAQAIASFPAPSSMPAITVDQLFQWAERTFPQYFPAGGLPGELQSYRFRYYPATDLYLAVEGGTRVVALGRDTGYQLVDLGAFADFAPVVVAAVQGTRTITHGGVPVQVVIHMPPAPVRDALVLYHGTVWFDDRILPAAQNSLESFRRLLLRDDTLLVSVAYPQQNREIGEGLREAEAALLWVKNEASRALGLSIGRVFIAGHSQGGYLVTRLNTLHPTDGVVASAPGPLDFEYRCLLEERGGAPRSDECALMVPRHGPASANPAPYRGISLLSYTQGFRADALFVQGLDDGAIQMRSWPLFRQAVQSCTSCQQPAFLEVAGGHDALFRNAEAREAFNQFIDQRRSR
jgi:hypothetical protein